MPNTPKSRNDSGQAGNYQIRIKGHLDPHWGDWFDRLAITAEPNGDTLLTGPVVDQAELHGLLRKLQDLGIPLLSFMRIEAVPADPTDAGRCCAQRHEREPCP